MINLVEKEKQYPTDVYRLSNQKIAVIDYEKGKSFAYQKSFKDDNDEWVNEKLTLFPNEIFNERRI